MADYQSPQGRDETHIHAELVSLLHGIAARKAYLPATMDGMAYADHMDAIAESVIAACLQPDRATLVATPEELDAAEIALEQGREAWNAAWADFDALDTRKAVQNATVPTHQIALPSIAPRQPVVSPAAPA